MRQQVWKFPIPYADVLAVSMPEGAKILHFGLQREIPTIWALVDPLAPYVDRRFRFAGTGHWVEKENLEYVGSVIDEHNNFVWHLFEITPAWSR